MVAPEVTETKVTSTTKFRAECVSCGKVFEKATVKNLENHIDSPTHEKLLDVTPLPGLTKSETILRQKLYAEFSRFLSPDLVKFACTICDKRLPSVSSLLRQHETSQEHQKMLARSEGRVWTTADIDMADEKRVKIVNSLATRFEADHIKVATKEDVLINSYLEYYKKPHLRENALYCGVCYREFERCNASTNFAAVRAHLATDQHQKAIEELEAKAKRLKADELCQAKLPISPARKICPRTIDREDTEHLTKMHLMEGKSYYSVDTTSRRSTLAILHRPISKTHLLRRGLHWVHEGILTLIAKLVSIFQIISFLL